MEELRSERTMLLNQLDCADDKKVNKVKTSVSNMKDTLKNLEASEKKFSAELEAAQTPERTQTDPTQEKTGRLGALKDNWEGTSVSRCLPIRLFSHLFLNKILMVIDF